MALTAEERRKRNTERARLYRDANREKVREISRRSNAKRRNNPETVKSIREYQQRYRQANAETLRANERKRKFGIEHLEYAELYKNQNGVCAVCKNPETATRKGVLKSLAVDHDHKTGKIRGLLCSDCNTGIGKLKDSVEVLQSAIRYLNPGL